MNTIEVETTIEQVRVKFAILEDEVIALFPDIEWDHMGNIMSYMHYGQHGAASKSLMRLRYASEEQYKNLKQELESIGYVITLITNKRIKTL